MLPLRAELDEMRALHRALREQHAVVGDDPDRHAHHMREAADQRRPEPRLELVEPRAVDQPRDHLADVVGRAQVGRHHAEDLLGIVGRLLRRLHRHRRRLRPVQPRHRLPRQRQRMRVVLGEIVGDPRQPGVHVAAAELLGRHLLAGRRLHQRRPGEEDRALLPHDDRHVRHRRHVGAAGGAGPHHHRDLRDPRRAHPRLVVEDPPEVVAVGEHLVLVRQVRPARSRPDRRKAAGTPRRSPARAGASSPSSDSRCRPSRWRRSRPPSPPARAPARCRRSPPRRARRRRTSRAPPSRRPRGTGCPDRAAPPPARAAASCPAPRAAPPPAAPPPAAAAAAAASTSASAARCAARLARNASEPGRPRRPGPPSQRSASAELRPDVADLAVEEEADHRADQHQEPEEHQVA